MVPANVKSPFQLWALLLLSVIDPPLVLSIVPPLMVNVPGPMAAALLIFNCPTVSIAPPAKVLAAGSVNAPAPTFAMPPAPLSTLASVTLFPFVSNVAVIPEPIAWILLETSWVFDPFH